MITIPNVVGLVIVGIAVYFLYRYFIPAGQLRFFHLRLRDDGLNDIPAIPFTIRHLISSLAKLGIRTIETREAKQGLSNIYTIGGKTHNAYTFLYGESNLERQLDSAAAAAESARESLIAECRDSGGLSELKMHGITDRIRQRIASAGFDREAQDVTSLQQLPLEQPEQFAMSWTTFGGVDERSEPLKERWAATMTDAETATAEFWPNIAGYGMAFNLLIVQKLTSATADGFKSQLGWSPKHDRLLSTDGLFVIDMSIFETVESHVIKGTTRFTPASIIYLRQDSTTKELRPFTVVVSGNGGRDRRVYEKDKVSESAWLYALLAARTSISVWGIWIGHVYHWHVVSAAMQMTMFNNVRESHALFTLLGPQSHYLITFDVILLLLWKHVAPPTSINSGSDFVKLMNTFAGGRTFFQDDPRETLKRLNITASDFTTENGKAWDAYPAVADILEVWEATEEYVDVFVDEHYSDDSAVQNDKELQQWFAESQDPGEGNIRFGADFRMNGRNSLSQLVTSLIYRVTVHGCSRMNIAANPQLSFVSNLPPCMQKDDLPATDVSLTTQELLEYLPNTGTIGEMVTFLFTFVYSAPYKPLIPAGGDRTDLFFDSQKYPRSNDALVKFRGAIRNFIMRYSADSPQIQQWPMNIET